MRTNKALFKLRPLIIVCAVAFLTLISSFASDTALFARSNLLAWCIVPFDAKKRGPEERAAMLEKLGFRHFAYDYRAEHIPTFDAEIEACRKHGVSIDAWWFPTELNSEAQLILDTIKRHNLKMQLWVMGGGAPVKSAEEQQARVKSEARRIRPIAEEAAKIGCTVGLYNHGNWFGRTDNQIAILKELALPNVGIVYNLHHGHDDLDRFAETFARVKPHLLALNLNGMVRNGDKLGKKILPLGQGEFDLTLLRIVAQSGWRGLVGILNHTDEDAEARLRDNLEGLDWLVAQLNNRNAPGRWTTATLSQQCSWPWARVSRGGTPAKQNLQLSTSNLETAPTSNIILQFVGSSKDPAISSWAGALCGSRPDYENQSNKCRLRDHKSTPIGGGSEVVA
jgi:sugar phosphate isomerase/epimerase